MLRFLPLHSRLPLRFAVFHLCKNRRNVGDDVIRVVHRPCCPRRDAPLKPQDSRRVLTDRRCNHQAETPNNRVTSSGKRHGCHAVANRALQKNCRVFVCACNAIQPDKAAYNSCARIHAVRRAILLKRDFQRVGVRFALHERRFERCHPQPSRQVASII